MSVTRIRVKERDAIIQSLKSGVTPRIGIQHIQVGRVNEITALHQDIVKWSTKTGHRVRVFPVSIFRFVWG